MEFKELSPINMLIPDISWCDAPGWADYLAQDCNGLWYWYSNKPRYRSTESYEWRKDIGLVSFCHNSCKTNPFWRETVYTRPI
jgi:hypothetical protein